MGPKVFICYRRKDGAAFAGRVHDRLERDLGGDLLFMDVDAIPLGKNFVRVLEDEVGKCDVLLAVIGANWLDVRDEDGTRCLDNQNDFVRVEIATALQRDIPVVPILIDGARLPRAQELPEGLQELPQRNALDVRHGSFHADMDKLIRWLKEEFNQEGLAKPASKFVELVLGKGHTEIWPGDKLRSQKKARAQASAKDKAGRSTTVGGDTITNPGPVPGASPQGATLHRETVAKGEKPADQVEAPANRPSNAGVKTEFISAIFGLVTGMVVSIVVRQIAYLIAYEISWKDAYNVRNMLLMGLILVIVILSTVVERSKIKLPALVSYPIWICAANLFISLFGLVPLIEWIAVLGFSGALLFVRIRRLGDPAGGGESSRR